jgi:hypothetical protein
MMGAATCRYQQQWACVGRIGRICSNGETGERKRERTRNCRIHGVDCQILIVEWRMLYISALHAPWDVEEYYTIVLRCYLS